MNPSGNGTEMADMEDDNPIPLQLRRDEFRFILLGFEKGNEEGKKPMKDELWQSSEFQYKWDNPKLLKHIQDGGNYGILGGHGGLLIVDCDNELIEKIITSFFPKTFRCHNHLYFICGGEESYRVFHNKERYADIQSTGAFVVAPNSKHWKGGTYQVKNDEEIAEIDYNYLRWRIPKTRHIIKDAITEEFQTPKGKNGKTVFKIFKPLSYHLVNYKQYSGKKFKLLFDYPVFARYEDGRTEWIYLELPNIKCAPKYHELCIKHGVNYDTKFISILIRYDDNFNYEVTWIDDNTPKLNLVTNLVTNPVTELVYPSCVPNSLLLLLQLQLSEDRRLGIGIGRVIEEGKLLELLTILQNQDPPREQRLYVGGFLKFIGCPIQEAFDTIKKYKKWIDFDEEITMRELGKIWSSK